MHYTVKRGEETFGPYTLADLQKYVQTGNVQPTDLAQSEGMSDWAPVSQVIGTIAVPTTSYGAAVAPALQPVATVPLPPNLHWSVVLICNIATRLFFPFVLFNLVWSMLLANWARKLDGDNNTLVLVAMYPAGFLAAFVAAVVMVVTRADGRILLSVIGLLIIGGLIAYIIGIFKIKAAMEEYYNSTENFGLKLSGPMTFFFSTIYLQYHVNEITKWKKDAAQGYL